ncbi:MAG: tyrosine-type recombinase/integrase [Gammaproteobacteria bacterium]
MAVEVRSIRQEVTLGEMFEIYIERYAKIHKKTWRIDEQRYNCHATKLSSWKLSSINSGDIKELVHYVARHKRQNKQVINGRTVVSRAGGEGAANQMLRLLKTVFNYAISEQWKGENPCNGIKEYPSQPRDRFLDKSEMPNFFKALSELQNHTMRDFFLMSLFTGARKANVMAMRWDQVNFDKATWFIPSTKNGSSHEVPLVVAALTLLELRKGLTVDDNAWVFMSSHSKSGTKIHDLRRSMGSWQVNLGSSLAIIGKSLNHKNLATTAIYAHVNKDPVRQSMEKASVAMIAASDKLGDEL